MIQFTTNTAVSLIYNKTEKRPCAELITPTMKQTR